ncbi:MAG: hypothetical protein J0H01_19810 [Rhizobiales bacterium]|nr:hypothetical protein [Hyphomicrobiales bacterium]
MHFTRSSQMGANLDRMWSRLASAFAFFVLIVLLMAIGLATVAALWTGELPPRRGSRMIRWADEPLMFILSIIATVAMAAVLADLAAQQLAAWRKASADDRLAASLAGQPPLDIAARLRWNKPDHRSD